MLTIRKRGTLIVFVDIYVENIPFIFNLDLYIFVCVLISFSVELVQFTT